MKIKDRGYIAVELDKPRHFKFDFTAARKLEDEFDMSLTEIDGKKTKIGHINRLFYAALIHEKIEGWSLESAEQMLSDLVVEDKIEFEQIANKLGEALTLYFGKANKSNKPPKN